MEKFIQNYKLIPILSRIIAFLNFIKTTNVIKVIVKNQQNGKRMNITVKTIPCYFCCATIKLSNVFINIQVLPNLNCLKKEQEERLSGNISGALYDECF